MKNVAGYPEVMPRNKFSTTQGQKSASRKRRAAECRSRPDLLESVYWE